MITKEISIEELVGLYPESVRFLMDHGIKPIVCGEPIWGTLDNAAKQKGYSDEQIEKLVTELTQFVEATNQTLCDP
jgi:methionine synthase II (cobalamin-independent)